MAIKQACILYFLGGLSAGPFLYRCGNVLGTVVALAIVIFLLYISLKPHQEATTLKRKGRHCVKINTDESMKGIPMLSWITANLATIIPLLLIAAVVGLILKGWSKTKRRNILLWKWMRQLRHERYLSFKAASGTSNGQE